MDPGTDPPRCRDRSRGRRLCAGMWDVGGWRLASVIWRCVYRVPLDWSHMVEAEHGWSYLAHQWRRVVVL